MRIEARVVSTVAAQNVPNLFVSRLSDPRPIIAKHKYEIAADAGTAAACVVATALTDGAAAGEVPEIIEVVDENAAAMDAASVALEGGETDGAESVWSQHPLIRGVNAENDLAETDYKDWFHVGATDNGKFPLVDFQQGNDLVSLKTVDSGNSGWESAIECHINDLATRGATVNGNPANMILDVRAPPGGADAAQFLEGYGESRGVTVIVTEYP